MLFILNRKMIFAAIIFPLQFTLSASQAFTQTNYYGASGCTGQPTYMTSVQGTSCLAAQQQPQCMALQDSVYRSSKTQCSQSEPLNLDGIVQWYVAYYTYQQSSSCEGNPSQISVMVADAACHPAYMQGGQIKSYFLVNCNGDRPIYKTCSDRSCNNCTQSVSSSQCQNAGASVSTVAKCLKNGKVVGGGPGSFDDSSATGLQISSVAVTFSLIYMTHYAF
jgi:hypothetical protein